jgi:type I restriction enzyme, S subunit
MSNLPPGWALATVEDLAARFGVTDGPFGSDLKTEHYTSSGPRVIRLQNIGDGSFRDERAHISSEHFERLRKHEVEAGDVLVAALGEVLPRACLAPSSLGQTIVKADCIRIRPGEAVTGTWLMLALNSAGVRDRVAALVKGVGRPRINLRDLRSLEIPVAPSAEQERIVTAIEEAFSKLDAGEAALRATRQRLKRLRESVLAAAVTGRLVPQDPIDEPALVNRASLVERSSHYEIPAAWSWCELNDVASLKDYGISAKAHAGQEAHDVPMLRMGNIQGGAIDPTSLKYVNPDIDDISGKSLEAGDMLFNRTNSAELVGKTAVYRGRPVGATFASYLIRVRTLPVALPAWCSSVINSAPGRVYISSVVVQQVGQANVNGTKLGRFPIPLPPVAEQHRIVNEMERHFSFIDACERTVDVGLVRSAALRRSILKSAFEGRLVPQDPADEPTAALLDRIQSERGAKDQLTKRRRTPNSRTSTSGPDGLSAPIPASAQKRTRDPKPDSLNDTLRTTGRRLG